ncbi:MAG: hypothetical protein K8W52_34820 [Deltaproteobacteria bacterium]|nr:hypothetical protein [Deltaproteobacteria bacterium]
MTDWHLHFLQAQPITIEACERALSGFGVVTTTFEPYTGNPRDFYARTVTLSAALGDRGVHVELRLQQAAWAPHDPAPIIAEGFVVVLRATSAPFAIKLATWHALRDALAALGCTDRTIEMKPIAIVDEARAAGDIQTAARLRAEIAVVRKREAAVRRRMTKLRAQDAARIAAAVPLAAAPLAAITPTRASGLASSLPAADERPVLQGDPPALRMAFQAGRLEVATGILDAASLAVLIEGGEYRSATAVVFTHAALRDEGVAYLARSGGFPAVTELGLGGTSMTDTGARLFAQGAVGLDRLETLDLGDVPAEPDRFGARDPSGVSDAGVELIACSSRLPALCRIIRRHEHRQPGSYREDTEIIAIARADGRVVESIIEHSIWP